MPTSLTDGFLQVPEGALTDGYLGITGPDSGGVTVAKSGGAVETGIAGGQRTVLIAKAAGAVESEQTGGSKLVIVPPKSGGAVETGIAGGQRTVLIAKAAGAIGRLITGGIKNVLTATFRGTATAVNTDGLARPAFTEGSYVRQQLVTDTVTFRDSTGVLLDPTTVVVEVENPQGVILYPTATRVSTGTYSIDIDTTPANGQWLVRWVGIGSCQAAVEDNFFVNSVL